MLWSASPASVMIKRVMGNHVSETKTLTPSQHRWLLYSAALWGEAHDTSPLILGSMPVMCTIPFDVWISHLLKGYVAA